MSLKLCDTCGNPLPPMVEARARSIESERAMRCVSGDGERTIGQRR